MRPIESTAVPQSAPLIICEYCDSVHETVPLGARERAYCVRCGALLQCDDPLSVQQLLALSISAALIFIFANVFPVISITMQGLSNQATLSESVLALAKGPLTPIALVAGMTIIVVPFVQITLSCWLTSFAVLGRAAPGFKACMRTREHLRPWSMLEVGLLGVLVAIVKLAGMLDVHPGMGLWALGMLTVLVILISGRGIRRLWKDLEDVIP